MAAGILGSLARHFSRSPQGVESNFGAMCDRVSVHAHASVRCGSCDGAGFRELSEEDLARFNRRIAELERLIAQPRERGEDADDFQCRREDWRKRRDGIRVEMSKASNCVECDGIGWVKPAQPDRRVASMGRPDSMFTTIRCSRCRGSGEVTRPTDASAEYGDVCPNCAGDAMVVPITVRERGSSKHGKAPATTSDGDTEMAAVPQWVDEDAMAHEARDSRAADRLRRKNPAAYAAFEAYYGPGGDLYGGHQWGRVFALWPLTKSGSRLVTEARDRSLRCEVRGLTPLQILANERDAERRADRPTPRRQALLRRADHEARLLLDEMRKAAREVEAA